VPGYSRASPAVSWHSVDENTYEAKNGYPKGTLGMEFPWFFYVPRIGGNYAVGFLEAYFLGRLAHLPCHPTMSGRPTQLMN
jgi:hypothetical protein